MFKFKIIYLHHVIIATHPTIKTKFYMYGDYHT